MKFSYLLHLEAIYSTKYLFSEIAIKGAPLSIFVMIFYNNIYQNDIFELVAMQAGRIHVGWEGCHIPPGKQPTDNSNGISYNIHSCLVVQIGPDYTNSSLVGSSFMEHHKLS